MAKPLHVCLRWHFGQENIFFPILYLCTHSFLFGHAMKTNFERNYWHCNDGKMMGMRSFLCYCWLNRLAHNLCLGKAKLNICWFSFGVYSQFAEWCRGHEMVHSADHSSKQKKWLYLFWHVWVCEPFVASSLKSIWKAIQQIIFVRKQLIFRIQVHLIKVIQTKNSKLLIKQRAK